MADKKREGFYDRAVMGLSISIMVLGLICIPLGGLSLYESLATTCYHKRYHNEYHNSYNNDYDYNNHRNYDRYVSEVTTTTTTTIATTTVSTSPYEMTSCDYFGSMFATGIWVGLMFIAVGVLGVIASKKKGTCIIVSLMTLSVPCFFFAVAGVGLSIYSQLDGSWDLTNERPMVMYISNGLLAFFSLIVVILDIILFSFSCKAVCCTKSNLHYTQIVNPEPEPKLTQPQAPAVQWSGFPQMASAAPVGNMSAPQNMQGVIMLMPDGKGGYIPFQPATQFQTTAAMPPAQTQTPDNPSA